VTTPIASSFATLKGRFLSIRKPSTARLSSVRLAASTSRSSCKAMPRESIAQKAARAKEIVAILHATYPDAHCELNYTSPLELLIATILSAQANDKQVNVVTADLFKKYKTV